METRRIEKRNEGREGKYERTKERRETKKWTQFGGRQNAMAGKQEAR
jgi:hypothetical protein